MKSGEGVGGAVADVFRTLADNLGTIVPVMTAVVSGFVIYRAASLLAAAATAIQTAGTVGATGATWSLNASASGRTLSASSSPP